MIDRITNDNLGVSPVIAVILLVAITVILSAAIGVFVFGIGDSVPTGQQKIGAAMGVDGSNVTVDIISGGDSSDSVILLLNGTKVDNISNPTPGDSLSVTGVHPDASLTIVSVRNGEREVVTQSNSPTQALTIAHPFKQSLLNHWRFDHGKGDIAYDSMGSGDAEFTDGVWSDGITATSIRFNATRDSGLNYSSLGLSSVSGPWTFSLWTHGSLNDLGRSSLAITSETALEFEQTDNTGKLGFTNHTGFTSKEYVFSNASTPTNRWAHIVFVSNGTHTTVYIDGQQKGVKSAAIALPRKGLLIRYEGRADDIRTYDRALNTTEVRTLYNATR